MGYFVRLPDAGEGKDTLSLCSARWLDDVLDPEGGGWVMQAVVAGDE